MNSEWLYGSILAYVYMCVYRYPMKLGEKGRMMDLEDLIKRMGFREFGPEQSETN